MSTEKPDYSDSIPAGASPQMKADLERLYASFDEYEANRTNTMRYNEFIARGFGRIFSARDIEKLKNLSRDDPQFIALRDLSTEFMNSFNAYEDITLTDDNGKVVHVIPAIFNRVNSIQGKDTAVIAQFLSYADSDIRRYRHESGKILINKLVDQQSLEEMAVKRKATKAKLCVYKDGKAYSPIDGQPIQPDNVTKKEALERITMRKNEINDIFSDLGLE